MNEPEYKKLHRIEIAKNGNLAEGNRFDQTVVATSTFTRDDYETMKVLRRDFLMFENFGVLRHVARYVRQETGVLEVDLYDHVSRTARAEPERVAGPRVRRRRAEPAVMAPPVSWRLFVDEVHRLVVDQSAWPTTTPSPPRSTVQHALLPARTGASPPAVELAHDFPAWHADMLDAKARVGARLDRRGPRTCGRFGPGVLEVADPHHLGTQGMGYPLEQGWLDTWDLESPVARPTMAREFTT